MADVFIDIVADNEALLKRLQEADARIAEFQAKANAADEGGLGFKKSVGAITAWIGKVTAAVGIATTFYTIGVKVGEVWGNFFDSTATKLEKFNDQIVSADATKRLDQYNEKIAQLEGTLNTLLGGASKSGEISFLDKIFARLDGSNIKTTQGQLDALRKSRDALLGSGNQSKQIDFGKSLEEKIKAQNLERAVNEEERIVADGEKRKTELKKQYAGINSDRDKALFREAIKNEDDLTEQRLRNAREARADEFRSDTAGQRSQLALTDQQRIIIESEEKIAEIRAKYRDRQAKEEQEHLQTLVDNELKIRARALEKIKQQQLKAQAELLKSIQAQQGSSISGFGLDGLGTRSQLDFMSLVLPTILRQGGGR